MNPESWAETIRHLAAGDEPPGVFWVKPRNLQKTV